MGNMSWEEIGKGLVVLAGSLTILAGSDVCYVGSYSAAAMLWLLER